MSKYQTFQFKSYNFDTASKQLSLQYGYDDSLTFTEVYTFNFDLAEYDPAVLDKACQLLFFIAGVSYYKAYLAPEIIAESGQIDAQQAQFLSETYRKGLGEFFYVNNLDPNTQITFPTTQDQPLEVVKHKGSGFLVGLGGGKDSLVSVDLLQNQPGFSTWSLDHRSQLDSLVDKIGSEHFYVQRKIDNHLLEINEQDALNGHVPISAIIAAAGVVTAVLSGKRDVVVSNESSASEATLTYKNTEINHQYSKSLEYELKFKSNLNLSFGDSIRYYSLLRPFSELRIAELFAIDGFEKYKSVFTSCNRAFRQSETNIFWCGECPKCAFVFLILSPFIDKSDLEKLYGKNMLLDPALTGTYEQLLGISGDKPLDCVGEIKESRSAMELTKPLYSGALDHFTYELPSDYDYKTLSAHKIPENIYSLMLDKLKITER